MEKKKNAPEKSEAFSIVGGTRKKNISFCGRERFVLFFRNISFCGLYTLSGSDHTYRDFQLDITLPTKLTYVGYEAGALLDGHSIMKSDQGGNKVRLTGYTTADKAMTAQNGTLLTIRFSAAADASGELTDGMLDGITLSDASAVAYHPTDGAYTITIGTALTLSEDEDYTPQAASGIDVNYTRTFTAGNWSTVCLPFVLTAEQMDAAFGSGQYKVAALTGVDEGSLSFSTATAMEANTPYIIKFTGATAPTSLTFTDVTIPASESALTVSQTNGTTEGALVGAYAETSVPTGSYIIQSNKMYYVNSDNVKIRPFRAYMTYTEGGVAAARAIRFNVDGETTGIITVNADGTATLTEGACYTLDGRRLSQKPTTSGVYIVNGKKMVIK